MSRVIRCALAAALVLAPAIAAAQDGPSLPAPRVFLDLSLDVGEAVGEFANYVGAGVGGRVGLRWRPSPAGPFGLRLVGSYLIYGRTTNRYPLVPGIEVDVTTNNDIVGMLVGPDLVFGSGLLQPYLAGGFGFSYFATRSHAEGSDSNNDPFASTTNYDDFTFATEGDAGLIIRLSRGRVPVSLDVGVRYLNNGRVTYVTEDGLSYSGNQLIVNPIESEANLMVYHIGVSVGLRAGGNKRLAN